MAKNYFIGIGGTGARLGEALIHLCAAGLGPKNLTLFLIDPDQGNGNLARTASLAAAYTAARARFTDRAGDDVVALGTDLRIPDPFVWHIFKDRNVRLAGHVGLATLKARNGALADFASVLFSEDEMETPLDEGFRGHPNIGSLVISDVPDDEDPWKTFWADVTQAQQAGEVQVFLAGSISAAPARPGSRRWARRTSSSTTRARAWARGARSASGPGWSSPTSRSTWASPRRASRRCS